ncbi:MAG: MurR/RpiR family transcriptional regulator [Pseudomonadota bacterium]|nr:MurR/RpiR family transcriptional regulator [Pseudomonadota bacterium]
MARTPGADDEETAGAGAVPTRPVHVSLERAIREQYDSLPESERRIADLILEFPGEVAAYTATELAELSNGSKAAVTRLVQRLGFASYEDARRAARDNQNWGSPVYLMFKDQSDKRFSARIQSHVEQDARNTALTMQSLRPDTVRAIVDAFCGARRVLCIGWRNSHFLAGYLQWQIIQVRPDVYLLPTPGGTLAEDIAAMGRDDLLVMVGMRRRVPEVEAVMKAARGLGTRVLYITDMAAPPAAGATWTLPCAVRGTDPFDRYGAALSLLHFLSVAVVEKMAERGREHLQTIERLHDTLNELS